MRGAVPKDPSQLRRRNKPVIPVTVCAADGVVHGPDLSSAHKWPAETRAWWQTWRVCAQAATFTDTDWSFLLDTAVLHAQFWSGNYAVAAELRLRVAKFGATPEDRVRLRLAVGNPGEEQSDNKPKARVSKTTASARRARLLKAVEDGSVS